MTETFKLTYATMFNPLPEELHEHFDQALDARQKPTWAKSTP